MEVKCPLCGQLNPPTAVVCRFCKGQKPAEPPAVAPVALERGRRKRTSLTLPGYKNPPPPKIEDRQVDEYGNVHLKPLEIIIATIIIVALGGVYLFFATVFGNAYEAAHSPGPAASTPTPVVSAPAPSGWPTAAPSAPNSPVAEPTRDGCGTGARAICSDGFPYFSSHNSGTCSRHGGVARWCN